MSPRNVKNKQTGLGYLETWQHRPQYEEEEEDEETETAYYITLWDRNSCTRFSLSFGLPRSFKLTSKTKWTKVEKKVKKKTNDEIR